MPDRPVDAKRELMEMLVAAKQALEFYADPRTYANRRIDEDRGAVARAALRVMQGE